jgi:uncharacterized protein YerC
MQPDILKTLSAIKYGNWTNAELDSLADAVKFARMIRQRQVKQYLQIGDQVSFMRVGTSTNIIGTVTKIAIKYVTVRSAKHGLWRVPASRLERVTLEPIPA